MPIKEPIQDPIQEIDAPLASIEGHEDPGLHLSPNPTLTRRLVLSSIGMLAAGLILAACAIHLCLRDPLDLYAELRSEKLAVLSQWRDRADSAAFGSSHVDNGFDPRAFDAALKGTSAQTLSLNLAVSGGSQTEQAVMARRFLESLPLPRPDAPARFVLLEITAGANFTNDHLFHPRAINIYDAHTVKLALQYSKHLPIRRAVGRSAFSLVAGLLHYLNVGMLGSHIFAPALNIPVLSAETDLDRRGLFPNPVAPAGSRELLANQAILAATHIPRSTPGEVLAGHYALLEDLAGLARQKHVQLVYFVAPRLDNLVSYPTYPASISSPLGPVPILNEAQPALHPELYRGDYWGDPAHFSQAGAAVFSRLLANDLKAALAAEESPGAKN